MSNRKPKFLHKHGATGSEIWENLAPNRSTAHFEGGPPGIGQSDIQDGDIIFKSPFPGELKDQTRIPGEVLLFSEK